MSIELPISIAWKILHTADTPVSVYTAVARQALVNTQPDSKENGDLLIQALRENSLDKFSVLMSIGIPLVSVTRKCLMGSSAKDLSNLSPLFTVSEELATLYLNKILEMSGDSLRILTSEIRGNYSRLDLFSVIKDNTLLASLYLHVGYLPFKPPNEEILMICGRKGLFHSDTNVRVRIEAQVAAEAKAKEPVKDTTEKFTPRDTFGMSMNIAYSILKDPKTPFDTYLKIASPLIQVSEIDSYENSVLLSSAFRANSVAKTELLFNLGVPLASDRYTMLCSTDSTSQDLATVYAKYILKVTGSQLGMLRDRVSKYPARLNMFSVIEDDDLLSSLYIHLGTLPVHECPDTVLMACGRAGVYSSDNLVRDRIAHAIANESAQRNDSELEKVKAELASLKEVLKQLTAVLK